MAIRETLTVSITSELRGFVRTLVSSGRYGSASEVVRASLRLLQREETAFDTGCANAARPPSARAQNDQASQTS